MGENTTLVGLLACYHAIQRVGTMVKSKPIQSQSLRASTSRLSCVFLHNITIPSSVCVFFTLNRSLYPSTSSTTRVRADSPILQEIQVLRSRTYATGIHVTCAVSTAVGNAKPCHHTTCDRHDIHNLLNIETKRNSPREHKNKVNKSKEMKKKKSKSRRNYRSSSPPPACEVANT